MEKSTTTKNDKGIGMSIRWHIPVGLLSILVGLLVLRNQRYAGDPIAYMLPNMLLYTPLTGFTRKLWKILVKYPENTRPAEPIPELQASEFSFEAMKLATNNFKSPAIVRGLFANTTAIQRWTQPGYIASYIGDYEIPVVKESFHDQGQQDRMLMSIRDIVDEILMQEDTRKYLFFPVKSRFQNTNDTEVQLENMLTRDVNDLVRKDLDLDRLWSGFGDSSRHKNFKGSQMIAGRGRDSMVDTTGTGWHCAPGNNWFIQVAGSKRWFFIDQQYSAFLQPQRGGVVNMATGTHMTEIMKYLPVKTVDVHAGDLLYNPDWEWHTIRNFPGLSIGCPIREFNISLSMNNNLQYTGIAILNMMLAQFGITYGLSSVG